MPGNFHIEAQSKHHNLNPALSNMSHVVNHLSFGPVLSKSGLIGLSYYYYYYCYYLHKECRLDYIL